MLLIVVALLGSLIATIIVVAASMLSSRISRHEDLLIEEYDGEASDAPSDAAPSSPSAY